MGCYYIPHIAVSFLTVGLLFLYGKTKKKPVRLASVAGISALAFISSLGGLRQIVVTYLPLIMAIFLICLYLFFAKGWENVRKCVYFRYLILSAVSLLFAGMGYIINVKVLLERYHFKEWDDMRFTSFNTERFATTVSDMFVTLGYKAEIVGASSLVSNVLCFVIAALLTVFIVQAIRRAGKVSTEFTLISVFFLCGIRLVVRRQQILQQFRRECQPRQRPHRPEAPLVVGLVHPVQQKNCGHRTFGKFYYGQLRRSGLPVAQTPAVIILPRLPHEKELPGQFLEPDVLRPALEPLPDRGHFPVTVLEDLPVHSLCQNIVRHIQPLHKAQIAVCLADFVPHELSRPKNAVPRASHR